MSNPNQCEQNLSETEIEEFLIEIASLSTQKHTVAKECGGTALTTTCEVFDTEGSL